MISRDALELQTIVDRAVKMNLVIKDFYRGPKDALVYPYFYPRVEAHLESNGFDLSGWHGPPLNGFVKPEEFQVMLRLRHTSSRKITSTVPFQRGKGTFKDLKPDAEKYRLRIVLDEPEGGATEYFVMFLGENRYFITFSFPC